MRYNNSIVTEEDFKKERERRDDSLLTKLSKKLNGSWIAYNLGYDVDYTPTPAQGQDE